MKQLVLFTVFLVAACSTPPCQDANAETGKGIYEQKCSNCHKDLPPKLDKYRGCSGYREKLTDCELQAISAYALQLDSVKH